MSWQRPLQLLLESCASAGKLSAPMTAFSCVCECGEILFEAVLVG